LTNTPIELEHPNF